MTTTEIEIPRHLLNRPLHQGRVLPWFVQEVDGVPDFRIANPLKLRAAIQDRLCWTCGEKLGKYMAFLMGPMCGINRVISEPPSHRQCAHYSAQVCPFLADPERGRREASLPDGIVDAPGMHIPRNPGVIAVWITQGYRLFRPNPKTKDILFEVGDPVEVLWLREGRPATREEVMTSIGTGLPILEAAARAEGPDAMHQLAEHLVNGVETLRPFMPAE